MSELKPCPHCGGHATFVKHSAGIPGTQGFDSWHGVACKSCGATVGACDRRFRAKHEAANVWDLRAQPVVAPQPEPLTDAQIAEIGLLTAWRHKPSRDPNHSETFTFNRVCLLAFARNLMSLPPSDAAVVKEDLTTGATAQDRTL